MQLYLGYTKKESMNLSPKISFCIPTYNQPDSMENLLASMLGQNMDDVEIVIRDDSTDDFTEKIVQRYSQKFSVRYFHGRKEGVDEAVIFLIKEARGEYIWWFGDDALSPSAIEKVKNAISRKPMLGLVIVNCRESGNTEPEFSFKKDFFFNNADQVIENIADMLGFISITIFRRDLALSGIKSAKKWVGSSWVTLFIVLHVLSKNFPTAFLSYPCVISKVRSINEKTWYDPLEVFAVNLPRVLVSFDSFKKKSVRKMLKINFSGIWRGILVHRAKGNVHTSFGAFSFSKGLKLARYYKSTPSFWLLLGLILLPVSFTKLFYLIYKKFFPFTRKRIGGAHSIV